MSVERELKIMNENLKSIVTNQAMIYALLQRLTEQLDDHSSTANTPDSDR